MNYESNPGQEVFEDVVFLGGKLVRIKKQPDKPQPAPPSMPSEPFNIECVIVCDRYHDFLTHTLPSNKFLFNRTVVVTAPEDKQTQRICEFYHVECVRTDSLRSRWGEFWKGKAINEGLAKLSKAGWMVHMDADIMLPPQTKLLLEAADLDKSFIYGIDRFIVKGYDAWDEFKRMPLLQQEAGSYIHTHAFPLGTRVMHTHAGGYVPIGFFQLWHAESKIFTYPEEHGTAGRGDTIFAQKWPRSKRGFIPEIIGYHIESSDSAMAKNWNGRTTVAFEPGK